MKLRGGARLIQGYPRAVIIVTPGPPVTLCAGRGPEMGRLRNLNPRDPHQRRPAAERSVETTSTLTNQVCSDHGKRPHPTRNRQQNANTSQRCRGQSGASCKRQHHSARQNTHRPSHLDVTRLLARFVEARPAPKSPRPESRHHFSGNRPRNEAAFRRSGG